MKPFRSLFLAPSAAVLGAMLVSGCYTQLALNADDSEGVPNSNATEVVQPPLVGVVVDPIYVPVQPTPVFLPLATTSVPPQQTSPQPSIRDIGSQRSGSSPARGSDSQVRTSGSTRGGR